MTETDKTKQAKARPKSVTKAEELKRQARALLAQEKAARELKLMGFTTPEDLPAYLPDEQNPDVLVRGRWLERGGSAWIVSTSGTGKSIHAMQLMLSFARGKPFSGLVPNRPLRFWYVQSEDSPTRLAIDRDDTTAELAETWTDTLPDAWRDAWKRIHFAPIKGCGAEFVNDLAMKLETARNLAIMPDVLVINPFLAIVGGPVVDGSFVTPFLRGGRVANQPTEGLQHVLEHYGVGALIYHHTPKPPTDKEIDSWLKSNFPEYQGAGSSDITNWGRSFITMMRVPGKAGIVCLTAGKNGADLGWDNIDGGYRQYMAWSRSNGVTGRTRHAWRELTDEELADVTKDKGDHIADDINTLVADLKKKPQCHTDISKQRCGLPKHRFGPAWKMITESYTTYGLSAYSIRLGRSKPMVFYGLDSMAEAKAREAAKNWCESTGNDFKLSNFQKLPQAPKSSNFQTPTGVPPKGGNPCDGSLFESSRGGSMDDPDLEVVNRIEDIQI